jgi:hypothetical protein
MMRRASAGSRDFLTDHHIDGAVALILRLPGLAPPPTAQPASGEPS